jgi:CheY-like chemotaxis protein
MNAGPAQRGEAPRLLIVDDSESVRRVIRGALEPLRLEIYEAANGRDALDLAADTDFDVIVTDIEMAPINGFALLSRLERLYRERRRPKVLICSALVRSRTLDQTARENDVFALIDKPIDPVLLLAAVAEAVGARG